MKKPKTRKGWWKAYKHKRTKRRAQQEAEILECRINNSSKEAEQLRKKGEWSDRYGRKLTVEERRAKRGKVAKGRAHKQRAKAA